MTTISEFTERLHNGKKLVFENFIMEYENNTRGTDYWDGNILRIEEKTDIYIYLSAGKKTLSTS